MGLKGIKKNMFWEDPGRAGPQHDYLKTRFCVNTFVRKIPGLGLKKIIFFGKSFGKKMWSKHCIFVP